MKLIRILKQTLCLPLVLIALDSCVTDGVIDCPTEPVPDQKVLFIVKAYADDGAELSADVVQDVTLYIFDGDGRFIQRIDTQVGATVEFIPPADGRYNVVAWGNLKGGKENMPTPVVGEHKSSVLVTLMSDPETSASYYPTDDIFFGDISSADVDPKGAVTIPMHRKTASMSVTISKLKEFSGYNDDDFYIVVRETYSGIDSDGNYTGSSASYRVKGYFDANGSFIVPTFNLLPGKDLKIEIYHGSDLISTITTTAEGQTIDSSPGKLTNVLIAFDVDSGNVSVRMDVTVWGDETVWKDY